jgi:tetratricopeptide (TPR) repeat protein
LPVLDHPSLAVLRAFLDGTLSRDEARPVVAHLLDGCTRCNAAVAPAVLVPEGLDTGVLPELAPGEHAGYDMAIERAFSAVRLHGAELPELKKKTARVLALLEKKGLDAFNVRRQGALPVYEALLARCQTLRHSDPRQMVLHALMAVHIARQLEPQGTPPWQAADLQARALGELANACRVADDLDEANRYMTQAFQKLAAGSGDPLLALRLKDLRASLLSAQHRYQEAVELLAELVESRLRLFDLPGAARAQINQAVCLGYLGHPEVTLRLLDNAAALLDRVPEEPTLQAVVLHNKLLFLLDLDRFQEARDLLDANRSQLLAAGGRLDHCKLLGIEGRILAALGHLESAEAALLQAKQCLAEHGLRGHEALATLDLSAVVMRQGRHQEGLLLAAGALQEFTRLNIQDQVAEALLVLSEAIIAGLTTANLVQSVADFIRRAEHNPRARYEPRFD